MNIKVYIKTIYTLFLCANLYGHGGPEERPVINFVAKIEGSRTCQEAEKTIKQTPNLPKLLPKVPTVLKPHPDDQEIFLSKVVPAYNALEVHQKKTTPEQTALLKTITQLEEPDPTPENIGGFLSPDYNQLQKTVKPAEEEK